MSFEQLQVQAQVTPQVQVKPSIMARVYWYVLDRVLCVTCASIWIASLIVYSFVGYLHMYFFHVFHDGCSPPAYHCTNETRYDLLDLSNQGMDVGYASLAYWGSCACIGVLILCCIPTVMDYAPTYLPKVYSIRQRAFLWCITVILFVMEFIFSLCIIHYFETLHRLIQHHSEELQYSSTRGLHIPGSSFSSMFYFLFYISTMFNPVLYEVIGLFLFMWCWYHGHCSSTRTQPQSPHYSSYQQCIFGTYPNHSRNEMDRTYPMTESLRIPTYTTPSYRVSGDTAPSYRVSSDTTPSYRGLLQDENPYQVEV